ncbi:MAG: hypothetical protein RL250_592 [Verrucomicrobiota bacterium]
METKTTRGLRYARLASYAFAALCVGLGLLELLGGFALGPLRVAPRWNPAYVTFPLALQVECWFFFLYAALLVLPWRETPVERRWWLGFAVLSVASLLFAFAMISEVMAKNYLATAQHQKARIPVFQAILLFLSLGQIPVTLFARKPELLD